VGAVHSIIFDIFPDSAWCPLLPLKRQKKLKSNRAFPIEQHHMSAFAVAFGAKADIAPT
jgi:hypothetical protein